MMMMMMMTMMTMMKMMMMMIKVMMIMMMTMMTTILVKEDLACLVSIHCMLDKDCNSNPISSFQPCYACQMIFTALAPRLIQSISRNVRNRKNVLKRLWFRAQQKPMLHIFKAQQKPMLHIFKAQQKIYF